MEVTRKKKVSGVDAQVVTDGLRDVHAREAVLLVDLVDLDRYACAETRCSGASGQPWHRRRAKRRCPHALPWTFVSRSIVISRA